MTTRTPIADQKSRLRQLALARRSNLPDAVRLNASRQIGQTVANMFSTEFADRPRTIVAGYWPIRDEVDPRFAMQALEQAGFSLALPAITGDRLRFHRYRTGEPLVAGRFKTLEPAPDCPVVTPAFVLVPLVAFDGQCQRLGYGAGFYDRTLAGMNSARPVTVGLAYECQLIHELPIDDHDQPLDLVLTESDLRRRRGHDLRRTSQSSV